MQNLAISIVFSSNKQQVLLAKKKLALEVYKLYLNHAPRKKDLQRFEQKTNAHIPNALDQYFDGRKIGYFLTKYQLDGQRSIVIEFIAQA